MMTSYQRFGIPIPVVVAGTRFGQFYAEAVARHPRFELVGILARGSQRSVKVAERYQVPLFTDVDQVAEVTKFVCVAVGTQALGGQGTELGIRLLQTGLDVLMEQPVHYRDLVQLARAASMSKRNFHVGDLYLNLPAVRQFVKMFATLSAISPPTHLVCELANQVCFPLAHLLVEMTGGAKPWSFTDAVAEPDAPIVQLGGKIAGIPVSFTVHNTVGAEVADADMPLLFGITVGFGSGRLSLRDPHGPIEWHPALTLPADTLIPADLGCDPSTLLDQDTTCFIPPNPLSLREALARQWVDALSMDMDAWRKSTASGRAVGLQRAFAAAELWHEMTSRVGAPRPVAAAAMGIDWETVEIARLRSMAWPQIAAESNMTSVASAVAGLDRAAELSMAALLGMHAELRTGMLFADLLDSVEVCPATAHIPRRWIRRLQESGWLTTVDGLVQATPRLRAHLDDLWMAADRAWEEAEQGWNYRLGSPQVLSYFRSHLENLSDLMAGKMNAVNLLFVEGSTEQAHALYRDTMIAACLNQYIGAHVAELAAECREGLRILEVGAGTGATCDVILDNVNDLDPASLAEYHYTDISAFFFAESRARHRGDSRIIHHVLDLQDPGAFIQLDSQFDVVVAAGVLNNVVDVVEVLSRMRRVLAPDGQIILSEAFQESALMLLTQAFMMSEAYDLRAATDTMFCTHDQWLASFEAAGLSCIEHWPPDDHPISVLGQRVYILIAPENQQQEEL